MDDRASRSHCIIIICVEINSAFRKLKCQQKLNIYCSENLNNQLPQTSTVWRLPKQSHYYCCKIAPFAVNKLLITFTEQLIIFPIKVVYFSTELVEVATHTAGIVNSLC